MIEQIGRLQRFALVGALIAVIAFFALFAPGFARVDNLADVLLNNFALLAIASLGMTLALSLGAIDLSLGVSIDVLPEVFCRKNTRLVGLLPACNRSRIGKWIYVFLLATGRHKERDGRDHQGVPHQILPTNQHGFSYFPSKIWLLGERLSPMLVTYTAGRSCNGHAYSHAPQPTQRLGSMRGCFSVFVLPAESITSASST